MSTSLTVKPINAEAIERVVIQGDLGKLSPEERVNYYRLVCESVGLNPLTKPFEYITLNNKLTLYARKDATDQLRSLYQVSVKIMAREVTEGCYVVTAQASFPSGRVDESIGAVPIENLKGEARANAMMKCETKAKRRVTLSACGLGMLDETEIETIPSAKPIALTTEPIPIVRKQPTVTAESSKKEGKKPVLTNAQRLHLRFKDALSEELKGRADEYLYEFLRLRNYVNDGGNGTAAVIPEADFKIVGPAAIAYAQELNQAGKEDQ